MATKRKPPKRPRADRRKTVQARLHADPERRREQWRRGEVNPKVRMS